MGVFDEGGDLLENQPDNRIMSGGSAQHEARLARDVQVLTGLRIDHQTDRGFIVSPRLSLKADLSSRTTARLNGGTGFRVVNLFTEDHAA